MTRKPWLTIPICGNRVPVYRVPGLVDEDGTTLDGLCVSLRNEILIRDELDHPRDLIALIHEAFHMAESELDMSVKHQHIYALSSVAVQVFEVWNDERS